MIVETRLDSLLELIGKRLSLDELVDTLFLLKAEVEKVENNEIEIEVNPDRQDMLSIEGIARAVRAFLGISPGPSIFRTRKSGKEVIVKSGLKKIRPYIACGIAKGVEVTDELIKDYMHLQEALTSTHGRNRSKASIGLYVHDLIKYPVIYNAKDPQSIKFAPLDQENIMDGPTILKEHEKGIIFGHIIAEFNKWPFLSDSKGDVLSLPPIINSNSLGRITTDIRNLFVEVTGTHKLTVDQAINIMMTSLAERGARIESLTVIYPDGLEVETPDLKPRKMKVKTEEVNKLLGLSLSDSEIVECLHKMCYGAKAMRKNLVQAEIPPYRTDILHPVDIMEDIAIGYGFDRIKPTIPQTMTTGKVLPTTRLLNKVRDFIVGCGYQEILSYVMSSPEIQNHKMLRDRPLVTTGNPKSREYSVLRNSLLPNLLDFVGRNQHADFPQKLFEVGYIVIPDNRTETRTLQIPSVSGLVTDTSVNLTELMTDLGFILRNMELDGRFEFKIRDDPTFIDGRCGDVFVDDIPTGIFGEISPQVLDKFEVGKPIVAFELLLPSSGDWQ